MTKNSRKIDTKIIGVSGGSCSGKTTLANLFLAHFGPQKSGLVLQDSYYIDQSSKFKEDGGEINFDHPAALDFDLLATHLAKLKSGQPIEIPIYDFVTHSRKKECETLNAHDFVFVDGILILSQPKIRELLDYSFFVDCAESLRLDRRKTRDTLQRGRKLEGVVKQFLNHVKPMHDQFVEPSRQHANWIVSGEATFDIPSLIAKII